MKSIPIKQAATLIKKITKTKKTQTLTLLTRKKDRFLTILIANQQLTLTEHGYLNQTVTYSLTDRQLKHQLQMAFKREFPRSHQIYISQSAT